jgi:putative pyruvate formate lyase activating enzyme
MCPAVCGFDRTVSDHPRCGGTGLRVATWGISLGDEPALSACGGSGVMMLSGCPLRCPSCHNPEMVEGGGDTGAGRFMEMAWSLLEQGAGNLQILSPTVHMPKLRHLLAGLRSEGYGIPVVLKSSGYESVAMLRQLEGLVDVYVPDFKYGRRSRRAAAAGAADYYERAREAIGEMFRQTGKAGYSPKGMIVRGVMVRHVRAPMPVSERESIRKFLDGVPEGVAVSTSDTFDILDA